MCGRSRLALFLLLALAARLGAQALPDIGEAEITDVKLLLLDEKNVSRGTLTAKSAKKARDGKITIEGAELKYTRDDGTLQLASERLFYTPGSSEFEAPGGFEAQLPDGGLLSVPKGRAAIASTSTLSLKAECSGEVHLRIGRENEAPLDARLPDAVLDLAFGAKGRAERINVTGTRGGRLVASLSRLPSLGSSKRPAVLNLSCSSDISLAMNTGEATLKLSGRVRGTLDQKERNFALSCSSLRLKVKIAGARFEPCELEAEGGARLTAEDLEASAGQVLLVEAAGVRTATLTRDARARTWRETESLEIAARQRALLRAFDDSVASLEVELEGSAHLFAQGQQLDATGKRKADWEIQGERIACARTPIAAWPASGQMLYEFEITGRGFAPLLLLAGEGAQGAESLSVFGKSANGRMLGTSEQTQALLCDVTVAGPDVFVSALGPFHLVRDLRKALGLRALEEAPATESEPGRVVIRAQQTARLNFVSEGGQARSLFASAHGQVEIRQEPAMRNDRELCTLSGSHIDLDVDASHIGAATIAPGESEVRATIGYDLVKVARFSIQSSQDVQRATLSAPGRVILRDSQTLAYLHGALSHLKVQDEGGRPDAAWIVFAGDSTVSNAADRRVFDFAFARLVFVRGDFVGPRAGPGAFDDLDELEDSDVTLLYEARGDHVLGEIELAGDPSSVQTLKFNMTLTGKPVLRSATDGILATAQDSIRIEAGENLVRVEEGERQTYLLGSVMRLGENASVRFEQASRYFDETGRLGGFSYDGTWTLRAADSMELSIAPPGVALQAAQRKIAKLGRATPNWTIFLDRLAAFETILAGLVVDAGADVARVEQMRSLLREAHAALQRAFDFACCGQPEVAAQLRKRALNCEARAFGLMGPEFHVAARGSSDIQLQSVSAEVPPLMISLSGLDLGFSALSEITLLRGEGPVRITRARYVVSGKLLQRERNGALTLDGARLTLPVELGFDVEGIDRISASSTDVHTMRVRVTGRQLRIKATLLYPLEKK